MKTYTGGQGYVYQYYFVGKRAALSEAAVAEYVFDVSSDRKITFSVSIFLPDEALRIWAATHGRALTDAEQYAAVKMRLFRAFDEIEDMMAAGRELRIEKQEIGSLLSGLGVQ
jgi:plasmid stability protein